MAGFSNSVNGLQPPDFTSGGPKMPKVSGRMPKYSRFRETVAGDRVRSTLRAGKPVAVVALAIIVCDAETVPEARTCGHHDQGDILCRNSISV
jgi:hypothetical protein